MAKVAIDRVIAGGDIGPGWTAVMLSQPEDAVDGFLATVQSLNMTAASVLSEAVAKLARRIMEAPA